MPEPGRAARPDVIRGRGNWKVGADQLDPAFPVMPPSRPLHRVNLWRAAALLLLLLLGLPLAGCAGDGEAGGRADGEWLAQVDTLGDTIAVYTLSGSEWGVAELVPEVRIGSIDGDDHEIFGRITGLTVDGDGAVYVYDSQVFVVRKFGADGRYLGTFGRKGGGPGEIENSDGGILALPDGRVVLRDPGNARFTVFSGDLELLESWPARGGFFTSLPLLRGRGGRFHGTVGSSLLSYAPDGTVLDSVPVPTSPTPTPTVSARSGNSSQTWGVPFAPRYIWTLGRDGTFITAMGDRYEIDVSRADGDVLRIGRAAQAAPVSSEERQAQEERVTQAMRNMDPEWRWNGPAIPGTKPLIGSLIVGESGRIWVLRPQPGERIPEDELEPPSPGQISVPQFRERPVFDVFETDGRFLGQVRAPHGFNASYPLPVMGRDHVWAVTSDAMGVQYLVKYRIDIAG